MKRYLFLILLTVNSKLNAQFTKLLDFASATYGSQPYSDMYSDGTYLYGTTSYGGLYSKGTLFKILPDGSNYIRLIDFDGTAKGWGPMCKVISDGTFLYGTTSGGGTAGYGTIFKIKSDGTGFLKIFDFTPLSNGAGVNSSLIFDGTYLYGTTQMGGSNYDGIIFKIKPDGTGFSKILDFNQTIDGSEPQGDLLLLGGFLYGTTSFGGSTDNGTLFKIKPDGTGYVKLIDFNGTNGSRPYNSLVYDGNFLYGSVVSGGTYGYGGIFKIKPNGTSFSFVYELMGMPDGTTSMSTPLLLDSTLYCMSGFGGTSDHGTIFKVNTDGTGYFQMFDFGDGSNGGWPNGSLISDGTYLYGTTFEGGASGLGTLFRLGISTGIEDSIKDHGFAVYPNPSTGIFQMKANEFFLATGSSQLRITNIVGQTVYESTISSSNTSVDFSAEADGIYFLTLFNVSGSSSQKLILTK